MINLINIVGQINVLQLPQGVAGAAAFAVSKETLTKAGKQETLTTVFDAINVVTHQNKYKKCLEPHD